MPIEISCRITGRVQMVMFRDFAQRKARKLRVAGWVHNEPDGSVSVVAQGDAVALDRYVALLRKGPVLARVDEVVCTPREAVETFDGFQIVA